MNATLAKSGAHNYALSQIAIGLRPESREAEQGKKDLFYLATEILGYKDVNQKLHREYCDFVSWAKNPHPKKLDLMPREHLKTTLGTVALAIQEIIRDPDVTMLISNFQWGNARKMLEEVKFHFMRNARFREIYGDWVGSKWNEDEIIVSRRTKPNKTPTIETAGLEKTLTSAHYKRIFLDDLVSRENIGSHDQVMRVIKYYADSLDLLDKKDGKLIIHGTRWSFHELYGWIIANHSKDFDKYIRRAKEKGVIIYPERFTEKNLAELKRQKGLADFACQYMNYVLDTENALVKGDEVAHYTDEDLAEYRKQHPISISMVVDAAMEEDPSACETAITIVGTTVWDEWLLLDERVGHWGPTKAVEEMVRAIEDWRPNVFGIQKTMFEKLYKHALEHALSARKVYSPEMKLLSKDPRITKHMQIMSLRPRIERKGLYWKKEHVRFEMAARQYPKTVNRDVLDSLSRHTEVSEVPVSRVKHRSGQSAFKDLDVNPDLKPWRL